MKGRDGMKKEIEKLTVDLLAPILSNNQCELVDVEYVHENGQLYLRVYADKDGGININDCEAISRALEKKLDELDPIKEAYILEVSSPGLDRPLKTDKDLAKHVGDMVELKLYKKIDGQKEFVGELLTYDADCIEVMIEDKKMTFPRKEIALIKLAIFF